MYSCLCICVCVRVCVHACVCMCACVRAYVLFYGVWNCRLLSVQPQCCEHAYSCVEGFYFFMCSINIIHLFTASMFWKSVLILTLSLPKSVCRWCTFFPTKSCRQDKPITNIHFLPLGLSQACMNSGSSDRTSYWTLSVRWKPLHHRHPRISYGKGWWARQEHVG